MPIKNSLDGLNTLCNTVTLASATVLALPLALFSLSSGPRSKFKKEHYHQVMTIARMDTGVFMASVMAFPLLNLPITESDSVPRNWFSAAYYISFPLEYRAYRVRP